MRVSMQIYFITFVLVLFTVVGCKNAVPEISLLKTPSLKTSTIFFDAYSPAQNPTQGHSAISISTLNPEAFSAYKFAWVSSLATCDSVDFESITAVAPGDVFSFTPSAEGSFRVCAIGKDFSTAKWQEASAAAQSEVIEVDRTAPTGSFSLNGGVTPTKDMSVSITLAQAGAAQVYLTANSTCSTGGQWSAVSAAGLTWSLTANSNNTVYAKFRDGAGNESACLSQSIVQDNTAPTLAVSNPSPLVGNLTQTYVWTLTYAGADNITLSSSNVTLTGTAAGCTKNVSGTAGSNARQVAVSGCTSDGQLGISIAAGTASDLAGNLAPAAMSPQDAVVNSVALTVAVSSNTGAKTNQYPIPLTITFSAPVSGFSSSGLTVTNGTISSVTADGGNAANYTAQLYPSSAGTVTVQVQANVAHDSGNNQNLASNTLSFEFDNSLPIVTQSTDTSSWTAGGVDWSWTCSKANCSYRSVVDSSSTTDPTGSFASSSAFRPTYYGSSGIYYLHVQAKDEYGNISATKHMIGKIDNTSPATGVVTFPGGELAFKNLTKSPVFNFTPGSDAHSGIYKTQARVVNLAETFTTTWVDVVNGDQLTDLSLTNLVKYKVQIRTIDHAGNYSTTSYSPEWMADISNPNNPGNPSVGGLPGGLDKTPIVSWTASTDVGLGIGAYEVALYKVSNSSVVRTWSAVTNSTTSTQFTSLSLEEGVTYQFRMRAVDLAGNNSGETTINWVASVCPSNYLVVPVTGYNATKFCVAKYEMKMDGGGKAVSIAAGTPWQGVQRGSSRSETNSAWGACGALGSNFDLISNAQWQVIARNIEFGNSNWYGGIVGSFFINQGYYNEPAYTVGPGLEASTSDAEGCFGTNSSATSGQAAATCYGAWASNKRTHVLSTGGIIWDFSGNVWEWVKDSPASLGITGLSSGAYECSSLSGANFANLCASQPYDSNQRIGAIIGGGLSGMIRGGRFTDGPMTGIYAANLAANPSSTPDNTGFRCVYNP